MRKRWLLNLALVAFIVALALLVKYQPGAHKDDAIAAGPPLTQLDATQVTQVRLLRPNQESIALVREDGDWRLTQPLKARADRFRIDGLLQLASAQTEATLPSDDLAKFGLDQPQATVWLNDTEIRLGNRHSLNEQQYVWTDNKVMLISAASTRGVASKPTDFLSTALLEKNRKPVAFTLPKFSLELQDGTWKRRPEIKDLSSDRINAFVEEWRHARALSVSRHGSQAAKQKILIGYIEQGADETARAPVASASANVNAVTPAKRHTLEIGIVSLKPEFVLHRADEGLDYHFPPDIGDRLLELKPE